MKKTVFITGASSGIGRATAKQFQAKGWNVVATMRKLENTLVTHLDVLDQESIATAVAAGIEQFGKIDVVVNNAGGPLEAFPIENIERQFSTNVMGLLYVYRKVIPHFREQKSGTLINVSSMVGKIGLPYGALYCGSKFAVEGISESLSFELEQIGARIKLVEPGGVATDFTSRSLDLQNDESLAEYEDSIAKFFGPWEAYADQLWPASLIAEVIYTAARPAALHRRGRCHRIPASAQHPKRRGHASND